MSFALASQSKNKGSNNKTSTPVKRSSHGGGVSNMAMTPQDSIIHLQQTIGNQAVQRLMRSKANNGIKTSIQPKLKVSQPGDVYEQEADKVAEQVMRMSGPQHIGVTVSNEEERVDRKCSACEMQKEDEDRKEKNLSISRRPSTMSDIVASNETTNKINDVLSSGGSSLDNDARELMESRFGFDFSGVHIHSDERAAKSSNSVNALAYTIGNDIVFGMGQYAPETTEGKHLLAHELTHTIQQGVQTQAPALVQRAPPKVPPAAKVPPVVVDNRLRDDLWDLVPRQKR